MLGLTVKGHWPRWRCFIFVLYVGIDSWRSGFVLDVGIDGLRLLLTLALYGFVLYVMIDVPKAQGHWSRWRCLVSCFGLGMKGCL